MRKVFALIFFIVLLGFACGQNIETNSLLVKASAKQGELETKSITITSNASGDFSLKINSIEGVSLKENNFTLKEGENKVIDLTFDSEKLEPGVYIGSLEVNGPKDFSSIPLLFEVETKDVIFDSNIDIPPAYKEVQQGSKLTYQIKIFDLTSSGGLQNGLGAVNVDINYFVYSLDGKVLITKDDQLVVDKQSQLTNAIGFPVDIAVGTYILAADVKYKDSVGISSQTFEIKAAQQKQEVKSVPNYALIVAVGIALVIFFVTLVVLIYLLKERDQILGELKHFNERETKVVVELLKEQKEVVKKKKGHRKRDLDKEISDKLKELKEKQQSRVYEIEKLEKAGSKKEIKKRLDLWRRKGYDTSALDYKMAGLTTKEMKELLARWKKQYSKKQKG